MPVTIAPERIQELVRALFERVPGSGVREHAPACERLCFVDDAYSPVSAAEVRRVAAANPLRVPRTTPVDELTDCDDYALQIKSLLTAHRRRQRVRRPPPAIGLVIAEAHAVNAFVSATPAGLRLSLIDASRPDQPVVTAAEDVPGLLLDRPAIRLIYF
jgi:hypothetical protein